MLGHSTLAGHNNAGREVGGRPCFRSFKAVTGSRPLEKATFGLRQQVREPGAARGAGTELGQPLWLAVGRHSPWLLHGCH